MKKTLIALFLISALLISLTAGAYADTVEPIVPEALRSLVAGKTFTAFIDGFASDEDMEKATLYLQICEQETYVADEIESLEAGDILQTGSDEFLIKAISQDEFGYELTGEYNTLYLYKNEAGYYYAVTETENRFYKNLFLIEVRADSTLRFMDWSDPEADDPTELTLKDLLTRYLNEEIHSFADNTEVTFDENGHLSEILYRYTPWN